MVAFARAAASESAFAIAAYLHALGSEDATSFGDAVAGWILGVAFLPGVIAIAFLAYFVFLRPTRWIVRDTLSRRTTQLSIAGVVGYLVSQHVEGPLGTVGGIAMLAGALVASFTGLGTQDRGPQPWVGLLFLAFVYAFAFANEDGQTELPTGWFEWAVAIVIGAPTLREGVKHWRTHQPRSAVRTGTAAPGGPTA